MQLKEKSMTSILFHFPFDSPLHFAASILHLSSFVYIYLSSEIWFGYSSYCRPAQNNFKGSFLELNESKWLIHLSILIDTDGESDWGFFIECLLVWGYGFETLGK